MPLGEYMRAVLKNNARTKRKGWFDEHTISERKSTAYSFDDKEATKDQLQAIRNRYRKERKKKVIIYTVIMIPALVVILWLFDYLFW